MHSGAAGEVEEPSDRSGEGTKGIFREIVINHGALRVQRTGAKGRIPETGVRGPISVLFATQLWDSPKSIAVSGSCRSHGRLEGIETAGSQKP